MTKHSGMRGDVLYSGTSSSQWTMVADLRATPRRNLWNENKEKGKKRRKGRFARSELAGLRCLCADNGLERHVLGALPPEKICAAVR